MRHRDSGQGVSSRHNRPVWTCLTCHFQPTLFKQACELGATSTSAFTVRVTHLLAANHSGAKYWVCLSRLVRCVS
jgi:hypothetical protein